VFLTKSRKANLDANEAAARARAAGKAAQVAAQNAADAARAAASAAQATAQNAAQKSQAAAQNATAAAQNAAQKSQAAAQNATAAAQNAALTVGNTAQTTAAGVSKQVQQGVYTARKWAAPKLESVAEYTAGTVAPTVSSALRNTADYTAGTVAPTVSSALRNTAAQVRPAEPVSPAKRRMKSAVTWTLLGVAVTAVAGAVAALVRYRQRAVAEIDSQAPDEPLGDTPTDVDAEPAAPTSAAPKPTPPKPTTPKSTEPSAATAKTSPNASANQTDTAADASVNGHVPSSGW
jgi:hypothetical protein